MAQIITNPTPQQRFQAEPKRLSAHRDMVGTAAFESASDFAMLEYSRLLATKVVDGNTSAATGLKLQGALEFLQTFRMLAESPTVRTAKPQEPLDYKA